MRLSFKSLVAGPLGRKPSRISSPRGSVLLTSVILMAVAGTAALSWSGYMAQAQSSAVRDRARLQAFYAAEAGVEQVVDFFNNPQNFLGEEPAEYTPDYSAHPLNYPLTHPVAPDEYALFQPYIISYAIGTNGGPLYKDGNLVVTRFSFFKNLSAGDDRAVSRTSKIPTCELDISKNPLLSFKDPKGNLIARVDELRLVHPLDMEAEGGVLPENLRVITKVIATGITPEGVRIRVESLITESSLYALEQPAAITTRATTEFNGNMNVHWGEIWARGGVALPTNWLQKVPRQDPNVLYNAKDNKDIWFRFRTEGYFKDSKGLYADGRVKAGFAAAKPTSTSPIFYHPYRQDMIFTDKGKSEFTGLGNMEQNQVLPIPDYNYDEWKMYVRSYGMPYYFTDMAGTLYGVETNPASVNFGKVVGKAYADWLNISPTDLTYDDLDKKIVFIDSVPTNDAGQVGPKDPETGVPIINEEYYPRNPRTDPAARMGEIKLSGGGLHTRGAIFLAANLVATGQGNPPSWTAIPDVLMPNYQPPPSGSKIDIWHNGLMYCWGVVNFQGNRTIYGSVHAEKGYGAGGDPEVYYNVRMRDGSWLNLNMSRVNRILWDFSREPMEAAGG